MSGGSEKHMVDAIRVYEINYKNLDLVYIEQWITKLSLETEWQKLLDQSEPLI